MLSPHQRMARVGLAPRVCGDVSSHIGRSAPPVPGGSCGRFGGLPLPATGRGWQGTRVPCLAGRSGPDGAATRVYGGLFLVSARGGSGPWGGSHTPHKGAAEGTEDLVHKGCMCCLGFRLSADGGLQLPTHRQRPDLVNPGNNAQVGRCGGLRRPLALGDGRPGGTSTSSSSPWCAISGAEPTVRGSRGHGLGARCQLPPPRWPSGGLGAGFGTGGWGRLAELRSLGAWSRRLPGSSGTPAVAG